MESVTTRAGRRGFWAGDWPALFPVIVAVLGFYAWTVGSGAPEPLVAPHQGDYYNLLTDGLADGSLYMKVAVDPVLLLPRDRQPPGGGDYLLDASLYRGHYYLYFGITPALTFFLPFRLLTGLELNQLLVVGAQASAAFLAGVALLLILRRRFVPGAGRLALMAAVAAWGFGSALPVTLRKPQMYEVAITAGLAWSTAFLLCAVLAVLRPARAGRWLALASLCAGLAAGSRPNLLLGLVALGGVLGWLVWSSRRAGSFSRSRALGWLAATLLPAALVGAGLLLYNYGRFGNPLEFGHRYQMGSSAEGFFSARYFRHNLELYYLTVPAGSWLFPFFFQGAEHVRPPGYIGVEPMHGQFFCLLWLGLLALVVTAARPRAGLRDPAGWAVAAILGWWFGVNFLLLAFTSVRADRYLLDFHPILVLAGGLLLLQAAALPFRLLRRLGLIFGCSGAAVIVFFNAAISVETMGRMRLINPVGYARLERAANRLVWPLFRRTAPAFGPRVFAVEFPSAPAQTFEPLLTVGAPLNAASLIVHYLQPGRAELLLGDEWTSDNTVGGATGPAFDTRPGQARRLTVEWGALLPPAGHPWFGTASPAAMQQAATAVRVLLDGEDVLRVSERPHPASPGQVRIGWRRPWASADLLRFSGKIRELPITPVIPADPAPTPGAGWGYRITVLLPKARLGLTDPFITTGIRPAGDALLLHYRDAETVELVHDERGGGLRGSALLAVDYDRPQNFEVWFDPVAPGGDSSLYRLSVFHAGRPVLLETAPLLPFAYGEEAIGANVVGSSMGNASFGGTILAVTRSDNANVSRHVMPEHGESAAAVRFRLPASADSRAQPLLVFTRADGRVALLAVRRVGSSLRIGWRDALGWWWSGSLGASADGSHTARVQWSLAGGPSAPGVMIVVDGVICLPPRPEFFSAVIGEVTAWHNPWPGDPGVAEHFAGSIEPSPSLSTLLGRRVAAPAGRHFQLAVHFPSDRTGGNEPLVTVGKTGQADGLYVHYERPGWVRLGFDHWGKGGPLSPPVPVAADAYEVLSVEFGDGPWTRGGPGMIKVSLDGRTALRAPAEFYAAPLAAVRTGSNPVGLSTSEPAFGGEIFPVENWEDKP